MIDYNRLGANIRITRTKLNLSQDKLAEVANVSTAFIGQIERADRKLSVETLVSIADALNVTTDYLLNNLDVLESDTHISKIDRLLKGKTNETKQLCVDMIKSLLIHLS